MNKDIFKFLKSYSCGVNETNRLIVSSFLKSHDIGFVKNNHINSLIINEEDDDFLKFLEFDGLFKVSSFEDLITAFEFVISPEEKVITGAIYTPKSIRDFIVSSTINVDIKSNVVTVCDIACGCGGFLLSSSIYLKNRLNLPYSKIFSEYIFGLDLMEYSVERTRVILSLLAILDGEDIQSFEFNLFVGNALSFDFSEVIASFSGFDAIVGNPPYVCSRNIDGATKLLLKNWSVSESGHPDLYIPFFQIGLSNLKKSGVLGYITMNSFFKSLNGRSLRKYFDDCRYDFSILDFGSVQVFEARSTYTCVCLIKNESSLFVKYKKVSSIDNLNTAGIEKITYDNLDFQNGWNLQSTNIIRKIESTGTSFNKVFKTSSGIATLKNNVFMIDPVEEDGDYYIIEDGMKIEKKACVDIVNPNKLIFSGDLDKLRRKIIFPYVYYGKKVSILSEPDFESRYPSAYAHLCKNKSILASRDKGQGNYPEWFAYGRSQGLEQYSFKLLFPHISPVIPNYVLTNDCSLLFHNGLALLSNDETDLLIAKKIMQSRLFWFYIVNTSKPYGSGYFSLSRNYLKSFGVYNFTEEQRRYLIHEQEQQKIDKFLEVLYNAEIPDCF
ncbi:HsdM family class I SAM-dependent methyltransferase [Photobacterium leiognathi]|uniref:HsdM family class I SAM-dependent methyltransferase n=1 Tax=Photobacterium leiognathi TaxID=553611 RepID=UPI003D9FD034